MVEKNETSRWMNQQNIREYEPNKENRFPLIEMISCSAQSERLLQIRVLNSHEMGSPVTCKILINLRREGQERAFSAFRRCNKRSHTSSQIPYLHVVGS